MRRFKRESKPSESRRSRSRTVDLPKEEHFSDESGEVEEHVPRGYPRLLEILDGREQFLTPTLIPDLLQLLDDEPLLRVLLDDYETDPESMLFDIRFGDNRHHENLHETDLKIINPEFFEYIEGKFCRKCGKETVVFQRTAQIRSGDEGETTLYKCMNCKEIMTS